MKIVNADCWDNITAYPFAEDRKPTVLEPRIRIVWGNYHAFFIETHGRWTEAEFAQLPDFMPEILTLARKNQAERQDIETQLRKESL